MSKPDYGNAFPLVFEDGYGLGSYSEAIRQRFADADAMLAERDK